MPMSMTRGRAQGWILVAACALLGLAARLSTLPLVFPEGGPTLLRPTDSQYYARFGTLQREAFPQFIQTDPFVNWPAGAKIIWPPLHALGVAAVQAALPADTERATAWVGPIFSFGWLILLGALTLRLFADARARALALLLLSLTPAAVIAGELGNADHHLHEVAFAFLLAALVGEQRGAPDQKDLLVGVVVGAGRLFFTASALFVVPVALALVLRALFHPVERTHLSRRVARTGVAAASAALLVTLAFGDPRSVSYESLTLFEPLFVAAVFAFAAAATALAAGRQREAGIASVVGLVAFAPVAAQILRGLSHLGRMDPLLSEVAESQHLFYVPSWPLQLLGPLVVLAPAALVLAVVQRKRAPRAPAALAFLAVFGVAALLQIRFSQALSGASAFACAALLPAVLTSRARGALVAVPSLLLAAFALLLARGDDRAEERALRPALDLLRDQPGDCGVLAEPDFGHLILLWANKPVIATPFSQASWHVDANRKAVRLLLTKEGEDDQLRARLREERLCFVLVAARGEAPAQAVRSLYYRLAAGEAVPGFRPLYAQAPGEGAPLSIRLFRVEP